MKIQVTAGDIANGKTGDCDRCPVALAITRATNASAVSVNENEIAFMLDGGEEWLFLTPEDASFFIERFDAGRSVVPFEFDMDLDELFADGKP